MRLVCTRVLWNYNGLAVLAGRSMDWPVSTEPKLYALPAGEERDGGGLGADVVVENPATWTSRYGSVVTSPEYQTVSDLTNLRYFFELTTSPNVVWVELGALDVSAGDPTRAVDPDDIALSGDVTARMAETDSPL